MGSAKAKKEAKEAYMKRQQECVGSQNNKLLFRESTHFRSKMEMSCIIQQIKVLAVRQFSKLEKRTSSTKKTFC